MNLERGYSDNTYKLHFSQIKFIKLIATVLVRKLETQQFNYLKFFYFTIISPITKLNLKYKITTGITILNYKLMNNVMAWNINTQTTSLVQGSYVTN